MKALAMKKLRGNHRDGQKRSKMFEFEKDTAANKERESVIARFECSPNGSGRRRRHNVRSIKMTFINNTFDLLNLNHKSLQKSNLWPPKTLRKE